LLWMVLISQSISKDSFDELTNLSWLLLSFKAWITSFPDLLVLGVHVEKSVVIIMGLPFYGTYLFPFTVFSILSFFCVLIIVYLGVWLFWNWWFGILQARCTWMTLSFTRSWTLLAIILLNRLSMPLFYISSPSSTPMIHRFDLFLLSQMFCMFY
jgi:hypothetical protein